MQHKLLALLIIGALAGCSVKQQKPESSTYKGHGATSVDPSVLSAYAPPSLPRENERFVQNILEITAPGLGKLSPDGKTMYFGWSVTGVAQIWKVDGPLRFPIQMTSGTDSTYIVEITPNGKYLVVSRDRAGEEDPGLYLLPAEGGPLIEIQHKKGARTSFAWVTNDSDTIYFRSNDIKPDSYAIYSYKISTGKKDLIFSEPGLWFVGDVYGDTRFLLGKATGAVTREYYEWSVTDRVLKPVIGQGEKEEYEVQFAADGDYLVLTAKFGEFKRLYHMKDKKFEPITPDKKMEIESFSIDHRRFRLYISWNDNGNAKLEVRDGRSLQPIAMPELKGGEQHYVGGQSRYGRYVTIGIETSLAPRLSYVFDWKDRSLTQWVKPSAPEVDLSEFARTSLESFPARDGAKVPMLVTRPKECAIQPCPVVVHFHGGPESQSRPGFNRLAQIFAAAGFVFVDPNVRGSTGYGKSWRNADDGPKRLEVITDIEDCAKYIRSTWAKDGNAPKIGVMGWSYGGYSTLMAMSRFAGNYDAGVALVGMSNLRTFLMNTAPYRRALRTSEYGDPEKDAEALEKLSPTTYLDKIRAPLMIVQGVSDPRVPVGEATQIYELLRKKNIPASLILFGDEGHGTQKRSNRVLELGHTLMFFQNRLLK